MLPSALWHRISTCSDMNTVMFRIKPIGTVWLIFVWNFLGKACWGFENLIMVLLPMCIICTGNFIHLAEINAGIIINVCIYITVWYCDVLHTIIILIHVVTVGFKEELACVHIEV